MSNKIADTILFALCLPVLVLTPYWAITEYSTESFDVLYMGKFCRDKILVNDANSTKVFPANTYKHSETTEINTVKLLKTCHQICQYFPHHLLCQ